MKKLLTLTLTAIALSVASLRAQLPAAVTFSTGTNVIAASGTLSPTAAIFTTQKNTNVGLQATFALSGTGVGNLVFSFSKSVDGLTYETVPSVTMTIAASGTNTVCGVSNVSIGAITNLKLVSVTNANTPSTVTGLTVKAIVKPNTN